jgi:hypothetical protein
MFKMRTSDCILRPAVRQEDGSELALIEIFWASGALLDRGPQRNQQTAQGGA